MQINPWLKTALIASLGGGVAAAFAAAMDPGRYQFHRDFGTGKLLEFFAEGAGMTFAALLIKSPLGQKAMQAYKDSKEQMKEDKALLEQTKAEIKPPSGPSKEDAK